MKWRVTLVTVAVVAACLMAPTCIAAESYTCTGFPDPVGTGLPCGARISGCNQVEGTLSGLACTGPGCSDWSCPVTGKCYYTPCECDGGGASNLYCSVEVTSSLPVTITKDKSCNLATCSCQNYTGGPIVVTLAVRECGLLDCVEEGDPPSYTCPR